MEKVCSSRRRALKILPLVSCCAALGLMIAPLQQLDLPDSNVQPIHEASPLAVFEACADQGTSPERLAEIERFREAVRLLVEQKHGRNAQYHTGGSWNGVGAPVTLSWSFVPDGLFISGTFSPGPSGNSELFSNLNSKFGGNTALWIQRFEESFDRISELTGITFNRVTSGGNEWDDGANWGVAGNDTTRGDIRIGMREIDNPSNTLAFANFPTNGDMVLDRDENWGNGGNQHRFLRDVVMHELGHSIGLQHTCSSNSKILMEPFIDTTFDGPRQDDIRGMMRQHGDPQEPDNSSGAATALGLIVPGNSETPCTIISPQTGANPPNSSICSIDANGEQDYWSFDVAGPSLLAVTLQPVGSTYDDSTQNGNGSCNSGNNINAKEIINLNFDVRDTNGSTILATAASAAIGSNEVVTDLLLAQAGTYFVRVYESGNPNQSQLYNLTISVENTILCNDDQDCNDGLFCNGVETCNTGIGQCLDGSNPCTGNDFCDEDLDACVECLTDADCDDGDPCTEPEVCNASGSCVLSGSFDDCQPNGTPDECDISTGASQDCDGNTVPDECDIAGGANDCNSNGIPDACDIDSGSSGDCNGNDIPDDCEALPDCNGNNTDDACDISEGTSDDFNGNGVPDECDPTDTYTVNAAGGADFTTIQAAVDAAKSHDLILVAAGNYSGAGNTLINFGGREVTLRCDDIPGACVIDGGGTTRAFIFNSNETSDARVEGFAVENCNDVGTGGAISNSNSDPTFDRCIMRNNTSGLFGGVMYNLNGNPTLINCTLVDNVAGGFVSNGGAIYSQGGSLTITNSTITNNEALPGFNSSGGGIFMTTGSVTITNSILRDNIAGTNPDITTGTAVVLMDYTNIGGGFAGTGNVDVDPGFVNAGAGDYHLAAGSAMINAGDPAYVAGAGETDIDGETRVSDGRIDIGSDELQSATEVCQTDLGSGGPGSSFFEICGEGLASGQTSEFRLTGAPALSTCFILVSTPGNPDLSFGGGTLLSAGGLLPGFPIALPTDGSGSLTFPIAGGGGPLDLVIQNLTQDGGAPLGWDISNAVLLSLQP